MVEVRVPPVLRKYTSGSNMVRGEGSTISELLQNLEVQYQGLRTGMMDDTGQVHRFINIYRNGEDIRYLGRMETPLHEGDVVAILPAVAGG